MKKPTVENYRGGDLNKEVRTAWRSELILALTILAVGIAVILMSCSDHNHTFISPVEPGHENLDHHQGCPNQSGRCHDIDSTVVGSLQ